MGQYLRVTNPVNYLVDTAVTPIIPDGSFVKWDTTALRLVPQATGAAADCIGVTEGVLPISSNIDNAPNLEDQMKVREVGEFQFKTTSGDTYEHGLALGVGADSETVKLDATAGNLVAIVWLPQGQSIAGGAGVTISVKIKPQGV